MDFEGVREQFPALLHKTFLDAACVSLAPRVATEAIQDFLDMTLHCPARSSTLHHISMDEMRSVARPEAARLIHADEDEIALVESTSHGLTIAAQSIPLSPGDRDDRGAGSAGEGAARSRGVLPDDHQRSCRPVHL